MMDSKMMSKMIRMKKKGTMRPDLDDAGQEDVVPTAAWDAKQESDINEALDAPDHDPASPEEMGEGESSQDIASLKKSLARLEKYFSHLMMKD